MPAEGPPLPPAESTVENTSFGMWNVPTTTLGGRQFWGDQLYFRGWRIQTNVFTGHSRLIDRDGVRHAWGTLDDCRRSLERIKSKQNLAAMSGRAVVFIHGIVRSSHSFSAMAQAIQADGAEPVPFDYPSTRLPVEESSEYLHRMLESLEGIERIDLVVHSMGGLVVRQYLSRHRDPRLGRMVMLGVPNHGANMANLLKDVTLFRAVYGPAGQQLVEGADSFASGLPVPDFPFAIIAGGQGNARGLNPWVSGDDDGTVAVESTRLAGAADFLRVPVLHTFMTGDERVIAATRRFLNGQPLAENGTASPIPKTVAVADISKPRSLNSQESGGASQINVKLEP